MKATITSYFILSLVIVGLSISPLKAQEIDQPKDSKADTSFIQKGKFLTGFSMGFINASRESYNHEFERELSQFSLNLDALYFVSDHVGVGPILGYEFVYRDLVPTPPAPAGDIDTRSHEFRFGAKAGWYTPAKELFGISSLGNTQFFVDGGVSWLSSRYVRERSDNEARTDYDFSYQIGTGLLIPLGKQIALETRLGFQSFREEYQWRIVDPSGTVIRTENRTKWPKEVAFSIGLKVSFEN